MEKKELCKYAGEALGSQFLIHRDGTKTCARSDGLPNASRICMCSAFMLAMLQNKPRSSSPAPHLIPFNSGLVVPRPAAVRLANLLFLIGAV